MRLGPLMVTVHGNLWSGSNVLSVLPLENSKEMQGSDADLRRVISWIENSSPPAALPSEGSYTLQTLCMGTV